MTLAYNSLDTTCILVYNMNVYYTWVMPFLNSRRDLSSGREEEGVEIMSKRRDSNSDKNEVGWEFIGVNVVRNRNKDRDTLIIIHLQRNPRGRRLTSTLV